MLTVVYVGLASFPAITKFCFLVRFFVINLLYFHVVSLAGLMSLLESDITGASHS